MKREKICIYPDCSELATHSHFRSYCVHHGRMYDAERKRIKYQQMNGKVRRNKCTICGIQFMGSYSTKYCPECRKKIHEQNQNNTKYVNRKVDDKKIEEHRLIAKQVGAITQPDDVVHHMDGNKSNNDPSNLVVLSLANHARLHRYLEHERLKQPNKSIKQLSWEFIWQNFIPYCFCNEVPGYHFPIEDFGKSGD